MYVVCCCCCKPPPPAHCDRHRAMNHQPIKPHMDTLRTTVQSATTLHYITLPKDVEVEVVARAITLHYITQRCSPRSRQCLYITLHYRKTPTSKSMLKRFRQLLRPCRLGCSHSPQTAQCGLRLLVEEDQGKSTKLM